MAQTYTHTPALSKVKLGATTYYLKDADARAILDTFGNVVTFDKASTVTADGTGVVDAALMYEYVGRQIGAIGQALNLLAEETDHTAVTNPQAGDFVVESDGKEWLHDGTAWREVGDETAYALKTTTIAGLNLTDNISVAALQTALGLKALAYKDNGTVAISTPDGINSFTTGAAGEYSVASTPVSVPATFSALDVTPAGSVELTAETAAAASYDKATSVSIATAAPGQDASPTYTPTGTVTVDSVTITPATGNVATVTSAGTAYQLTAGSCTQDTDTTSAFATAGVVATIDEEDTEMLVFTNATTANAVTASGAITYVDPQLSGALPTFGTQSVVTGITSSTATASFTGDGVMINATPAFTSTAATVTQPTFSAEFTGTSKNVTPVAATTVQAAGTDGKVTVASETITPTLTGSEKTASVTFGNN